MRRGSVPEVLRHGRTGLIADSLDELIALAPQLGEINRRACRREAERRFSTSALADGYEKAYKRVMSERKRSPELALPLGDLAERVPITA
jgi:hypothetical protein